VAADEVAKTRQRVRRKHRELAEAGKVSGGGTRPFGFEPDRVTVRPDEAAVVRELAGRLLAGESLRSLCRDLEARGITTSTGGVWKPSVLARTLSSARLSGQREHRGEIVGPAEWDAIVTPETTAKLRALGADRSRSVIGVLGGICWRAWWCVRGVGRRWLLGLVRMVNGATSARQVPAMRGAGT